MISIEEIQKQAKALGFDDAGITAASVPEEDSAAYEEWLQKNYHGKLGYMENRMRCDPESLLPGAKTAILFISYYKQPEAPLKKGAGLIAAYARGRKYHNVHHRRLKKFIRWLEERAGEKGIARGFSDSAPVLERALAVQAGLGWFGKNNLLIHRKFGTYTLLSGLFTTLEIPVPPKMPRLPRCGSCTRCLDACPTNALVSPYTLDAAKCLSMHLIELKEEIPQEIREKNPGYAFGCDICQEACPHNFRKKPAAPEGDLSQERGFGPYLTEALLREIEEEPEKLYGTALQRQGADGLRRNLNALNR